MKIRMLFVLLFVMALSAISTAAPLSANDAQTTGTLFKFSAPGDAPILTNEKEIATILKNHGSDLLVVNFWATFCGPCVEEMPYFVELSKKYPENRVRVVGLSVDLKSVLETGVKPFLKEQKIPYSNYLLYLDDPEMAINLFAKDWDGALPVTFFYDRSGKQIGKILNPVTALELNTAIEGYLKNIPAH